MTVFFRRLRSEVVYLYYHVRRWLYAFVVLWKVITMDVPMHTPREDGEFYLEDYTMAYCYECSCKQAVFSKGLTRCKVCGTVLLPCSACKECDYELCHYMTVAKHFPRLAAKYLVNGDISDSAYERYMAYHAEQEEQRWHSAIAAGEIPF